MIAYFDEPHLNLFTDDEQDEFIQTLKGFAPKNKWLIYLSARLAKYENRAEIIKSVYSSEEIEFPETIYFEETIDAKSNEALEISFSPTRNYKKRVLMNAYLWDLANMERDLKAMSSQEIEGMKDSGNFNLLDNMVKGINLFHSQNSFMTKLKISMEMEKVLKFLKEKKVQLTSLVSVANGRDSEEAFYHICNAAYLSFEATECVDTQKSREIEDKIALIQKEQGSSIFSDDLLIASLKLGDFVVATHALPYLSDRDLENLIDGCERIERLLSSKNKVYEFANSVHFSKFEIEKFKMLCEKTKLNQMILEVSTGANSINSNNLGSAVQSVKKI